MFAKAVGMISVIEKNELVFKNSINYIDVCRCLVELAQPTYIDTYTYGFSKIIPTSLKLE